jgi:hypothetical protein
LLPFCAWASCDPPRLAQPKSLSDRQPRLEWKAVTGASAYRVQVLSRVPNGRIVASHDAVVAATSFLPPRPLAEQHAKVTVRVRAVCGAEESTDASTTFLIDTAVACRLEDLIVDNGALKWPAVPGAMVYEVRTYSLDGALVSTHETRTPGWAPGLKRSGMVGVRPVCRAGAGETLYRVVAAD